MPYCIPPLPVRLRSGRTGRKLQERGYFIVELLAGLAVIAVLVTLALPALQTLVRTHRVRSVSKDLAVEISWAQAEAMRRGSAMTIRFESPPDCVAAPARPCGWQVFMDLNGDGTMQPDDTILRRYVSPADMLLKAGANPLFLDAAGNIRNKGGIGAVGLHVEVALIGARADDVSSHIVCFNAGGRIRVTGGQKCLS